MTRGEWKKRIIEQMTEAGTYQEYYIDVIDTLSGMLEARDKAEAAFLKSGGNMVNPEGGINRTYKIVKDLNRDALVYFERLGLTPSGQKKIKGEIKDEAEPSFITTLFKEA